MSLIPLGVNPMGFSPPEVRTAPTSIRNRLQHTSVGIGFDENVIGHRAAVRGQTGSQRVHIGFGRRVDGVALRKRLPIEPTSSTTMMIATASSGVDARTRLRRVLRTCV